MTKLNVDTVTNPSGVRLIRVLLLLLGIVIQLTACGASPASVCKAQCDKRAACGTTIDVGKCHTACESSSAPGSPACANANITLQQCQVRQTCELYLAGGGCPTEVSALAKACAP